VGLRCPLAVGALLVTALAGGWSSVAHASTQTGTCGAGPATATVAGSPTTAAAWRAEPVTVERPLREVPRQDEPARPAAHLLHPEVTPWLLVVRLARDARGRCWIEVRLPWRPNDANGWLRSEGVKLQPTPFRIVVSRAARTVTLDRSGEALRTFAVVVGKPATPTPTGLFSITGAWRSPPTSFLGSWILALTAHSDVLEEFEGGNGTVAIHGRGGTSLLDPLGSARSHGCIRLANDALDWLVRSIGAARIAGIPVSVR
jgi:lipoprotein-anchoring transpeptidase ErfK/SrfK